MKAFLFLLVLNISVIGHSQKTGFKDLLIDNKLTADLLQRYSMKADSVLDHTYHFQQTSTPLQFCNLTVETMDITTAKDNRINSIKITTTSKTYADFRALNYDWYLVLRCLANDHGSPWITGELPKRKSLVALWDFSPHTWFTVSTPKMYAGDKNKTRTFLFEWQTAITPS
jgi:hypothetical protein